MTTKPLDPETERHVRFLEEPDEGISYHPTGQKMGEAAEHLRRLQRELAKTQHRERDAKAHIRELELAYEISRQELAEAKAELRELIALTDRDGGQRQQGESIHVSAARAAGNVLQLREERDAAQRELESQRAIAAEHKRKRLVQEKRAHEAEMRAGELRRELAESKEIHRGALDAATYARKQRDEAKAELESANRELAALLAALTPDASPPTHQQLNDYAFEHSDGGNRFWDGDMALYQLGYSSAKAELERLREAVRWFAAHDGSVDECCRFSVFVDGIIDSEELDASGDDASKGIVRLHERNKP